MSRRGYTQSTMKNSNLHNRPFLPSTFDTSKNVDRGTGLQYMLGKEVCSFKKCGFPPCYLQQRCKVYKSYKFLLSTLINTFQCRKYAQNQPSGLADHWPTPLWVKQLDEYLQVVVPCGKVLQPWHNFGYTVIQLHEVRNVIFQGAVHIFSGSL